MRLCCLVVRLIICLVLAFTCVKAGENSCSSVMEGYTRRFDGYRGWLIDSVIVDNRNIFDTECPKYRHFAFSLANKFHYKTRRSIVRQEILLRSGEPFSPELAEETARNLRQRLKIYDAWVSIKPLSNRRVKVRVVTIDEWSLSGGVDIKRDGNETRYEYSVTEKNLLGRNIYLSASYYVQSSYENYFQASLTEKRLFGYPLALSAVYNGDPLGTFRQVNLSHPYYNLEQTSSFGVSVATTAGRRETWNDSALVGQAEYEGDIFSLYGSYRTGTYTRKLLITPQYTYRFERTFNLTVNADNYNDSLLAQESFAADSLYHQLGGQLLFLNQNFITLQRIDGYGYTEDFVLGTALGTDYARAFTANFTDYLFDRVSIRAAERFRVKKHLFYIMFQRHLWFRGSSQLRQANQFLTNYYYFPRESLTIAARGIYVSDDAGDVDRLSVGGMADIRGYDKVFMTGNRKAVFNVESRFNPRLEFLTVLVGGVIFVDAARSWKYDEPLTFRDFRFSVGFGLRLALERLLKNKLLRFDVAYSDKNGWQLSFGTGQYFLSFSNSFFP